LHSLSSVARHASFRNRLSSEDVGLRTSADHSGSRRCGFWTAPRLELYGYATAGIYASFLAACYHAGTWIVARNGVPIYTDFACAWIASVQALHGHAASLYDPVSFIGIQAAVVGPRDDLYPNWPYPPIFLLIMAPFAALQYLNAFLSWDVLTLIGCLVVAYAITRCKAAIALVLACPFTAWNFLAAQNGFLTASLLGASLLFLERRPLLAGICIGCLTYKPQFGVLVPVALVAAQQWRTIASATVTAALLAGACVVVYGGSVWAAFPRQLIAQTDLNLLGDANNNWGYLQSIYGLVRTLHVSAAPAWLTQGVTMLASAVIVWLVWRSRSRFSLKAAVLSGAALLTTPYAFAYDMAAVVVPAAFLIKDQIGHGWLKGEAAIIYGLFGTALGLLIIFGDTPGTITFGSTPIGVLVAVGLSGIIVRRLVCSRNGSLVSNGLSRSLSA
jgi:arabinofuranan 3-O-arabinosyltransferase